MQWIKQTDLNEWADRKGSRIEFPVMIRDLVLASAPDPADIRHIRFPGGESGEVRGYDGDLVTAVGSTYVPSGRSVWEFGTNEDPLAKFKSDYSTRVKGLKTEDQKAEAKAMTFVFVTPRNYNHPTIKLPEFMKDFRDEGHFTDVLYYDGAMLETWLEERQAVGAKHARLVLGHVPKIGARSTEEFWSDFSKEYNPELTEAVALCARSETAERIVSHLMSDRGSLVLVGDGPDEVSAVAVAAIRNAGKDDRNYLEARTLVVDTDEAGRRLSVADRYSFIVSPSVKDVGAALSTFGPAISTLDYRPSGGRHDRLERPSIRDMSEALQSMGYSEEEAETLARKTGRSLTVLQRHIGRSGAKRPEWRTDGGRLVPALLAGAWNARQEGDRAIVAELSGVDYDAHEAELRRYLEMHDTPIDLRAGIWKLRAPVDAFVNLAHLVTEQQLRRLASAALKVFATTDPPDIAQERFGVSTAPYSSILRDGIATTLLIVAAMHEEVGLEAMDRPAQFVADLVASLPGLTDDPRVIFALERQLTYLMEAAPGPLLSALEQMLEGDRDLTAQFFTETLSYGVARSRLPNLLWALELQAWDPQYFRRVALLLSKLDALDPGGKSGNRPIDSLRDVFVAWAPGTNATLVERIAVLDEIIAKEPKTGWRLTAQLLPKFHDVKSPTQRPRFRDAGASEREVLTVGKIRETYDAVTDRALSALSEDSARWKEVVEAFPRFSPERRAQFLNLLTTHALTVTAEDRVDLRRQLRAISDRHARFRSAEWAMSEPDLAQLQRILAGLESTDPMGQARELFDEWMPLYAEDYAAAEQALDRQRRTAVAELAVTGGAQAVRQLAGIVRNPRMVAYAVALGVNDGAILDGLLCDGEPDAPAPEFSTWIAGNMRFDRGPSFNDHIADLANEHGWSPVHTASMLLTWPEDSETWRLVDSLGTEAVAHFWANREPRRFEGGVSDLQTLVKSYVAAGRAGTALEAIYGRENELEWSTVRELLSARADEISARGLRSDMDGWHVSELFKELRTRAGVDKVELARLEYAFFPVLEHEDADLALFELMATDPEFFVSILRDVYVEDGTDPGEQKTTEEERLRGNASHRILIAFDRMPGAVAGTVDEAKLTAWIDGMIEEGRKAKRSTVIPMYIGRVMAHAQEQDGVWPPDPVARAIERLASDDVERSIMIERFNMRGVYTKAMFDGGKDERDLADLNRGWANARTLFPRTKAMLNAIAGRWDDDAKRADEEAERDRLRFEG